MIVFVYKTRKIYSKVYQGKSNTLTKVGWGGGGGITKLLHLTRVPSDSKLPPVYTALVVGKGVAQDCIFL